MNDSIAKEREGLILHHRVKDQDREIVTSAFATHGGLIEFMSSQREAGRITMRMLWLDSTGQISAVVNPIITPEAAGPAAQRLARADAVFSGESNDPELKAQIVTLYESLKSTRVLGDAEAARIRTVMDGIIKAIPMEQQSMGPAAGRAGR